MAKRKRPTVLPPGPELGYQLVFWAYLASRLVFYLLGIRFNAAAIVGELWQLADPQLLRHDLWGVIKYLWTQPPLFNALVGTAMQQSPAHWPALIHGLYIILGAAISVSTYGLMVRLGVQHVVALVLALFYTISPVSILYENWLFYEHPVMALLTLAALQVHQFMRSREWKYALSLMLTLAALVLLRSMFHPVYMLAVGLLVLAYARGQRRLVLVCTAIALVPVALWFGKIYYLTGTVSGSGWSGMNLYKVAGRYLDEEERQQLIAQRKISPVADYKPFSRELGVYLQRDSSLVAEPLHRHHPLLDDSLKSSGQVNFHQQGFVSVSRAYGQAARYVMRHYPFTYFKAVSAALFIFFETPTHYHYLQSNLQHIALYNQLFYGYNILLPGESGSHYISPFSVLLSLAVLWYAFYWMIFRGARDARVLTRAQVATILFMAFTVVYVSVIGITMEYGENMRFRVQIIPFTVVFAGLLLNRFVPARFRPLSRAKFGTEKPAS